MLDTFFKDSENKIKKSIDFLRLEYSKLLLSSINVNVIKSLSINYNNEKFFLYNISVISLEQGVLFIKPFEKKLISVICTEIVKLKLDINPFVVNDMIKVSFPSFTMERRQLFLKKAKKISDDTKISIRNIRKNIGNDVKLFLKNNKVSLDDEKKFFFNLQKTVDANIDLVDTLYKKKEKDLLTL